MVNGGCRVRAACNRTARRSPLDEMLSEVKDDELRKITRAQIEKANAGDTTAANFVAYLRESGINLPPPEKAAEERKKRKGK